MNQTLTSFLTAGLICVVLQGCTSRPLSTEVAEVEAPTPLMRAAAAGDTGEVRTLIRKGELVNAVAPQGTALTEAAEAGHQEVMMLLLQAGADPNLGQRDGQTSALHQMTAAGNLPGMRALIASGASLEQRDPEGLTPIAYAVRTGSLPATKTLIAAGADVNVVIQGKSLLMHVVEQNSLLMAQVLIKAGADVNYQADTGETALEIARSRRLGDLEMLLLQSGARS